MDVPMLKQTRKLLLIPVEIILFWEFLFFFWWLILIGGNAPREFNYDWNFIIFITVCLASGTTPGLSIAETAFFKWLNYRAEQIEIGKREPNRVFKWLSKRINIDKSINRYMKKYDHGDHWYE
jgi:hypothetical protein